MAEQKILSNEELRRLQLIELQLLREFDRVCRENDICYVIAFGSMLGAVRHKGFIPWDDDIDVVLLRKDYEKFKKVSDQLDSKICFFQDNSTDPDYLWGYGKIRKTGTVYVRAGQEHIKSKTGIFMDVFPLDDVPQSLVGCVIQDIKCFFIRKILWSKVGFKNSKGLTRFLFFFMKKIKTDTCFKALKKLETPDSYCNNKRVRILMMPCDGKANPKNGLKERYGFKKEWITDRKEYLFEGYKFFGTQDYDAFLKYLFDDYMSPPPENCRGQHSPVSILDFGTESEVFEVSSENEK